MVHINIIDACKKMYGVKKPKAWPGTLITNFNEFRTACYGSCARFNNLQSINQVRHTECGQQCEEAMLEQIQLNGRSPCANWIAAPLISLPPRFTFAEEYENTDKTLPKMQRGEIAKKNALQKCRTAECIEQVELDSLALFLSEKPPSPNNIRSNTCSNVFPQPVGPNVQKPTIQKPTIQKPTIQKPTIQKPTIQKPTIESFKLPKKEKYKNGCGCGQSVYYWILGIGITLLVIFLGILFYTYFKKK